MAVGLVQTNLVLTLLTFSFSKVGFPKKEGSINFHAFVLDCIWLELFYCLVYLFVVVGLLI